MKGIKFMRINVKKNVQVNIMIFTSNENSDSIVNQTMVNFDAKIHK